MNDIKVGDVVAWADVPQNAAVLGPKGVVFVRRGPYVDYHVVNVGRCSMHIHKACPVDQVVKVIALNVPRQETADDLRRLAEVFEVREDLHASPGLPGFWRVGLNSDVPGGEMVLGGFSGSADDAMQFWAERLHAAGWRPGMTAEDAARMLAQTGP